MCLCVLCLFCVCVCVYYLFIYLFIVCLFICLFVLLFFFLLFAIFFFLLLLLSFVVLFQLIAILLPPSHRPSRFPSPKMTRSPGPVLPRRASMSEAHPRRRLSSKDLPSSSSSSSTTTTTMPMSCSNSTAMFKLTDLKEQVAVSGAFVGASASGPVRPLSRGNSLKKLSPPKYGEWTGWENWEWK